MLVDRYGRNIEIGEWFIRLDQHNEGRLYILEGYADDGRIAVHEHLGQWVGDYPNQKITALLPVHLKQTIKKPLGVLWYPETLLPEIRT